MRSILTHIRGFASAVVAGALGGALLGVGESILVIETSAPPDEYWVFLFGAAAYGLVGAALGLGAALVWQLVRRGRAAEAELAQVAIGGGVFLPVLAVARYHVAQRLFEETLPLTTSTGIAVHGLLVLGALVAAGLGIVIARLCHAGGGLVGLAGALALIFAGAAVTGAVTDRTRPPTSSYASRPTSPKANVILIVVDTLRADAAQWVREQPGSTGFAQLTADGVVFDHTYSQASWTRPSIASILTSTYPSVHRTTQKMDFLPDAAFTLAEAFKAERYWTAAFTTNINVAPIFNFQQGFDEFHYLEPSFYFGATDSATRLAVYKGLRAAREKVTSKMWVENYYQDAAVVDRNVDAWLAHAPPEPFFLFIHYMDPHDPYFDIPYNGHGVARVSTPEPSPERVEELHDIYRQDVRYLDGYLQQLVQRLKQSGLYDRSVVAVTADHGEEFHEHGGWWHGTALYDEQVHVPLIFKHAKEPEAGRHRVDTARSVDLAPTLVAAAGLPVPESFEGIDLFSGTVSEPVIAEEDLEGNRLASIRAGDWKLITANRDNPRGLAPLELFNLGTDPDERTNVASQQTDRVNELLARLEQLRAQPPLAAHNGVVGAHHSAPRL